VRARRSRALIADAGGSFLSHSYAAGDLVLNPFDQRTVDWSPFAEIREPYDCARIARAAVPDGTGQARCCCPKLFRPITLEGTGQWGRSCARYRRRTGRTCLSS
jgi:hypothetical protein